MSANTKAPPKLKQLNISLPEKQFEDLVRAAGEEQVRTGKPLTLPAWARQVLLEKVAA